MSVSLNSVHVARMDVKCFSHALSQETLGNNLAGLHHICKNPLPSRCAKYVHNSHPKTPPLAWSRVQNGRWAHPKGHPVWRLPWDHDQPDGLPCNSYTCKCDMKAYGLIPANLEQISSDRTSWRTAVKSGIQHAEKSKENVRGKEIPSAETPDCHSRSHHTNRGLHL